MVLGTVVFPEQVCLEPFLEGGETVSVSDGGGELIPPLGSQTGEEFVLGPIHNPTQITKIIGPAG